jgi:hypothetical protein
MQEHWRHQLFKYDIISFWGALDNVSLGSDKNLAYVLLTSRYRLCQGTVRGLAYRVTEAYRELNADHRGLCKFGPSQTDQDNFKLVQSNIKDLYKTALKNCK